MPGAHAPAEVRFWRHVRKTDGCWEWTASTKNGYGQFKAVAGRTPVVATRFLWEMIHGPIPDGLFVCHRCDNPPCVRPDHLFLGTHEDNMQDMVSKGRQPKSQFGSDGKPPAHAKLTPALVRVIRERYAAGDVSTRELALQHGVHKSNIVRAIKGTYWRDIPAA